MHGDLWTSWRAILDKYPGRFELKLAPPPDRIVEVEKSLGQSLPKDLRVFYDQGGSLLDHEGSIYPIWSLGSLVAENLEYRSRESEEAEVGPGNSVVFFGEDGCGNMYGIRAKQSTGDMGIVFWDHEVYRYEDFADDLSVFLWYMASGDRKSDE